MSGKVIAVRVTEEQARHLAELARRTGRNRSQVLRLLIEAASAGTVDVRLTSDWNKRREVFRDGSER